MIRAKKSLGQNFLTDHEVARRIVDEVAPLANDIIVEIGPGTGALTRMLVERSAYVVAIEIDTRLVQELRRSLVASNLSIVSADALNLDWSALISDAKSKARSSGSAGNETSRIRIVANLPYYISTAIIEKLIGLDGRLFDMTLMLQNEVADRIATGPGSREYGYLSVLVQYYCEASKLFEVPSWAFTPAPKVQSAVIRLTVRDEAPVKVQDEKRFFALVRAAFAQRRKTILNNLKAAQRNLEFTQPLDAALAAASVAPQRRAETLSLAEFSALYTAIYR